VNEKNQVQDELIIKTENITKKFNKLVAVNRVKYSVKRNEITAIVGPKEKKKTTLFNLITGYYFPDEGTIFYKGEDITRVSPEKRVSMGMMRTFQLTSTFDNLRVIDNLMLAYFRTYKKPSVLNMILSPIDLDMSDEKIKTCLEIFDLNLIADKQTGQISLGEKRRLEIAMALIADPQVLLLDEPLAGLSEAEISEILQVIRQHIHKQTIIIVEHKITRIQELAERFTVMNEGEIIADGKYDDVINAPEVRKSYWKIG